MRSTLKRVKWQTPSSRSAKAFPRCGSLRIHLSSRFDAWLTPKLYVCDDCGYSGPIIMEIEENNKKRKSEHD